MDTKSFNVNYSINDLRKMIIRQERYCPVNFINDIPIHKYLGDLQSFGEVFIPFEFKILHIDKSTITKVDVDGSNFGRIKYKGKIIEQFSKDKNQHNDYLIVDLDDNKGILVHRIIAAIWCPNPYDVDYTQLEVHHISNNGFDNRPCNLLWVNKDDHYEIEKGILRFQNGYEKEEYRYI